jgi:small-conductance mechanosensitive channel
MFLTSLFSWWYGCGWKERWQMCRDRLLITADFFSIKLLLKTLFAPFRQISAGNVSGSLSIRMHAFFDRTLSRVIGATVRILAMISGIVVMTFQVILSLVILIFWPLMPLLPLIGLIGLAIGWVPQWIV